MKDGLSQKERMQRIGSINSFEPLDNRWETLLQQAEDIASFIRYFNPDMQPDGYFDAFLNEIKKIDIRRLEDPVFDGCMEPSQAILYTFLHNLKEIIYAFNQKWKEQYIPWYFNRILGIQAKPPMPDFAWISFQSGVKESIRIRKDRRFTYSDASVEDRIYYCLTENIEVNAINITKAYMLYLEKNSDIFPANLFDFPVALHKKDYLSEIDTLTSGTDLPPNTNTIQSIGLQITSSSFILRTGKRKITLCMQPEKQESISFEQKRKIVRLLQLKQEQKPDLNRKEIRENGYLKLLDSLFYLEISTGSGWETIESYTVYFENGNLNIRFLLEENFPSTTACSREIHQITTEYPVLKILLNYNAWLYPYAWMKNFYFKKITVNSRVENASNLLFYNELGMVDTSKPFSPFGINTEQGTWFVLGSYEMAKKRLCSLDLKIQWQQLPSLENGLYDYYSDYGENINNHSFKIRPQYLSDYKWNNADNTEPFYLFSTVEEDENGQPEAEGKLINESWWRHIRVKNISPVRVTEENYRYTILSQTGFFRFELENPQMGLGEKHYRRLYTKQLMSKAFRKGKETELNQPLNPQINRITFSYEANDEIDLLAYPKNRETCLHHIYPLGEQLIYPKQDNRPLPFVHALNNDMNILFGLENVKGDEILSLYFEFSPTQKEISLSDLPVIVWYWGDGYHWERLPDGAILRNTTQNLLTNGFLKLYIPPVPEKNFRDANGTVWIAAGVEKNEQYVAPLAKLHNNAAIVIKDLSQLEKKRPETFLIDESEKEMPGITGITQITPFDQRQKLENDEQKYQRISEYISHRQRAVTARDYERMTLQAFPEIEKVKCLYDTVEKKVRLVIIPKPVEGQAYDRPYALPELLLDVEKYFRQYVSATVRIVDAISPVYEEILVRCEVALAWVNYSKAASRAMLTKMINQVIAPWQKNNEAPCFGYSFTVREMQDKISRMTQVEEIKQLSIIRFYRDGAGKYLYTEYTNPNDKIQTSVPYAILVPGKEHLFVSGPGHYGLEEMNINENFII